MNSSENEAESHSTIFSHLLSWVQPDHTSHDKPRSHAPNPTASKTKQGSDTATGRSKGSTSLAGRSARRKSDAHEQNTSSVSQLLETLIGKLTTCEQSHKIMHAGRRIVSHTKESSSVRLVEDADNVPGWEIVPDFEKFIMHIIMSQKPVFNSRGVFGETILHLVCLTTPPMADVQHKYYHALVRYIIKHHRTLWNGAKGGGSLLDAYYTGALYYGETAAHICAVTGQYEVFKLLVEHGADVTNARACGAFFLNWNCPFGHHAKLSKESIRSSFQCQPVGRATTTQQHITCSHLINKIFFKKVLNAANLFDEDTGRKQRRILKHMAELFTGPHDLWTKYEEQFPEHPDQPRLAGSEIELSALRKVYEDNYKNHLYYGERVVNFIACSESLTLKRKKELIEICLGQHTRFNRRVCNQDSVKLKDKNPFMALCMRLNSDMSMEQVAVARKYWIDTPGEHYDGQGKDDAIFASALIDKINFKKAWETFRWGTCPRWEDRDNADETLADDKLRDLLYDELLAFQQVYSGSSSSVSTGCLSIHGDIEATQWSRETSEDATTEDDNPGRDDIIDRTLFVSNIPSTEADHALLAMRLSKAYAKIIKDEPPVCRDDSLAVQPEPDTHEFPCENIVKKVIVRQRSPAYHRRGNVAFAIVTCKDVADALKTEFAGREGFDPQQEPTFTVSSANYELMQNVSRTGKVLDVDDQRDSNCTVVPREHWYQYDDDKKWKKIEEYSVYKHSELTFAPTPRTLLRESDILGNNILHNIVRYDCEHNTGLIKDLYGYFVSRGADQHKTNIFKMTPLMAAAAYGANTEQFDVVLRQTRLTYWQYGPIGFHSYELSEIDCVKPLSQPKGSQYTICGLSKADRPTNIHEKLVLSVCIERKRTELLQENVVLRHLIEDKWNAFGEIEYGITFLVHVLQLIAVSVAVWMRKRDRHLDLGYTGSSNLHYSTPADTVRLVAELTLLVFGFYFANEELDELKEEGFRTYWIGRNTTENFLTLGHVMCVILLWLCKLMRLARMEAIALLLVTLSVWMLTIYFLRALNKSLGVLIICTEKIFTSDILKFMVLYVVLTISFSQAFFVLYSASYSGESHLQNPLHGIFALFQHDMGGEVTYNFPEPMFGGLSDPMWASKMDAVGMILYFFHAIIGTVLLLNLLIAMMGKTFEDVWDEAEACWALERAEMILTFEDRIDCRERWVTYMNRSPAYLHCDPAKVRHWFLDRGVHARRCCVVADTLTQEAEDPEAQQSEPEQTRAVWTRYRQITAGYYAGLRGRVFHGHNLESTCIHDNLETIVTYCGWVQVQYHKANCFLDVLAEPMACYKKARFMELHTASANETENLMSMRLLPSPSTRREENQKIRLKDYDIFEESNEDDPTYEYRFKKKTDVQSDLPEFTVFCNRNDPRWRMPNIGTDKDTNTDTDTDIDANTDTDTETETEPTSKSSLFTKRYDTSYVCNCIFVSLDHGQDMEDKKKVEELQSQNSEMNDKGQYTFARPELRNQTARTYTREQRKEEEEKRRKEEHAEGADHYYLGTTVIMLNGTPDDVVHSAVHILETRGWSLTLTESTKVEVQDHAGGCNGAHD